MTRQQQKQLRQQRIVRVRRVRANLHGTAQKPRISVNRSNQYVYIQAIDDDAQKTMAACLDRTVEVKGTKLERAKAAAKKVAESLKKAGVKSAIFDRGAYRYHGRVRVVAETLREEGIEL